MRREDAPPPGWYPDPTGSSQLWWWDGLDWTDHRRAPPTRMSADELAPPPPGEHAAEALQRQGGRIAAQARTSLTREDRTAMIAEVRKVAREEVDRAVDRVTDRARSATRDLQPLVSEYGARVMKWIRIVGIIAIALFVLWMVLQTVGQASLLDWIGDRIDNLTSHGDALPGDRRALLGNITTW